MSHPAAHSSLTKGNLSLLNWTHRESTRHKPSHRLDTADSLHSPRASPTRLAILLNCSTARSDNEMGNLASAGPSKSFMTRAGSPCDRSSFPFCHRSTGKVASLSTASSSSVAITCESRREVSKGNRPAAPISTTDTEVPVVTRLGKCSGSILRCRPDRRSKLPSTRSSSNAMSPNAASRISRSNRTHSEGTNRRSCAVLTTCSSVANCMLQVTSVR